jgi:hypothetical protein
MPASNLEPGKHFGRVLVSSQKLALRARERGRDEQVLLLCRRRRRNWRANLRSVLADHLGESGNLA